MTVAAHKDLVNAIREAISARGAISIENQTGEGWVGKFVRRVAGVVTLENARPIKFGEPGSSDIIACASGRSVYIECKTGTGRLRENQRNFRDAVTRAGGIHIEARSVADVIDTLTALGLLRDAA